MVLGANFLLKTFETLYLFNYHFQAVALAINLILWSGTMLQKKATPFNWSLKGLELFWWCWTRFPIWRVSSLFNLQHVHRKQIQKLDACFQQKLGYVFVFCQYIKDPKNLKLVRHFYFVFQKKLVLISDHTQNFLSWSLVERTLHININCSAPKTVKRVNKIG